MKAVLNILSVLLLAAGSPAQVLEESFSIDISPGGYAWSVYSDDLESLPFTNISTFAPGPWLGINDQRLLEVLPDSGMEALASIDEWLIPDLLVRFADLLYKPVDLSSPVYPAFADINGDNRQDLVLTDGDGNIRVFTAPFWEELQDFDELVDTRTFCDINNDGLVDSASISQLGSLIIYSEGLPFRVIQGFDFSVVTGIALSDMEGDGLADLIAGTESGKVLVYRNLGTVEAPCFLPFSSQSELLFPMNPGAFAVPAVYRTDDSTLCLAIGTQQSGLHMYSAITSERHTFPDEWVGMNDVFSDKDLLNISPVEIDLSGETRFVCGTRSGVLYEVVPGLDSLQMLYLPPVPGAYPVLAFGCIDGDEEPDLIAGTVEGDVFMLKGMDGWFDGSWECQTDFPKIPSGAPACYGDGIIFGSKDGDIRYFVRTDNGIWVDSTENSHFLGIDVGEYSNPCFADLNDDGFNELIIGNSSGSLTCFEIDDDACDGEPLYIEKHSWRFSPNRAVSQVDSYYSRYFFPYTLLRTPSDSLVVNAFAGEILRADPLHRDEIAYCIAHTPAEVLRTMYENGDSDLFSENASLVYSMADELEYVRLAESVNGTICELLLDTGWTPVTGENYYRFVVHPRILFEVPARIDADYWMTDMDSREQEMDEWLRYEPDNLYGESETHVFWRQTIPSDSTYGQMLIQKMREARTYEEAILRICNFQSHSQPNGIMTFGYLTNDLQPMVIYRKGYGSCGEQSILQTALCRAFFIPAYVVGCRGEDHQWNQYLDPADGRWNHWDINYGIRGVGHVWVSGEGVNHSGKTISTITAFGPDDTIWPVTKSVSLPESSGYMIGDSGYTATAQVEITVTDSRGTPVEGAMVLARSHWDRANMVSMFNYTDELGRCSFELGWEPFGGYTLDIVTPYGVTGSSNISFTENRSYSLEYSVPGTIPDKQEILLPDETFSNEFFTTAEVYPVSYYTGTLYSLESGEDDSGGYKGTRWTEWVPGSSSAQPIFMDGENFRKYVDGFNCRALPAPFTPEAGDTCFIVLDNRNNLFTWRRFFLSAMSFSLSESCDLPSCDKAWLNESSPARRIPGVFLAPAAISSDSSSGHNWIKLFPAVQIEQDDADDPLSAEWILGPFQLPAEERSLSMGTTGNTPGLDMDMFLFEDQNNNRLVDGMSELAVNSTSPTSNENIFISDPDSSAVYWIYMQGWSVPGEGGDVDLGLAFEPEMLRIHSIEPVGYLDTVPERFSFQIEPELRENEEILILFDTVSAVPRRTDTEWIFDRPSQSSMFVVPILSVLDEDGRLIERVSWIVQTDSIAPIINEYSVTVDSAAMLARISVYCQDEDTGISKAILTAPDLEEIEFRLDEDSVWTGEIDLTQFAGQVIHADLCFTDMAGNEAVSEPFTVSIPDRPVALFNSVYPKGTTYDHRPIFQICADFRDKSLYWEAHAMLSDSSGNVICELDPVVTDGDMVQFRPVSYLDNGEYNVYIAFLSVEGEEIAGHSWSFTVDRMRMDPIDAVVTN